MPTDRIEFIDAYCDRWCERCAFTERCSTFACRMAIEMCGDTREGLELAIGMPHPAGPSKPGSPAAEWLAGFDGRMTPAELAAYQAEEEARDERIDDIPLSTSAAIYSLMAFDWFRDHDSLGDSGGPLLAEAVAIVGHDSVLIRAKIGRALDGRDRFLHGEDFDDDPVQNDWNGSAKVALVLVNRSEAAWRTIAGACADPVAEQCAEHLDDIRRHMTTEFPAAMEFIRPGFDEPR